MEIKIFDNKDTNPNDREEDIKKKDKDNIDLLMASIYSHTVAISRMR